MSVSTLVLLGLAVVWAIVLLPEVLKKLSGVRAGDSIRSFRNQLSSLERSVPGGSRRRDNVIDLRDRTSGPVRATQQPVVPPAVRRRRQEVLGSLAAAAVLSLLCTVAFGGAFLFAHLVVDALLVAYLVLLNQANAALASASARRSAPGVVDLHGPARDAIPLRGGRSADGLDGAIGRVSPLGVRRIAN